MNSLFSAIAGATVRWHDLPGSGLPVVFIHGLGCAASYEYPRIVADSAFGHRRAILIDLPGSGFSDKPHGYAYTTTQQAAVVVEILDSLKIAICDLYGHSMGGSIAIEAADMLGERVRSLAVSEPNFYPGGGFFSRQIAAFSEVEFTAKGFAQILAQEESPWKGCLQLNAPWALWRAATSLVTGIAPSWMDRFRSLRCEKTLIFGAHSLPDADAEAVAGSGIPLHIIPDAGHSLSWENPSVLAGVLGEIFVLQAR
ncbi:alpha/beta hydrolase [Scandinavium sp.]|uniref:alpha/beta fold hydrolase n=1 Tax=Scandinavium sp. TaxID=2830653 RepID=UPI002896E738|nr:alpha/beta hydrolase [Scandinavium sp.]